MACKSLKKGKLDAEDLKKRLQKIAKDVTGGDKTDEILKKKEQEDEPAGESTIIMTPEGAQGAVPAIPPGAEASHEAAPSAADVARDDKGAADAAEKATARRLKAGESKAKKEKGHGKGKR